MITDLRINERGELEGKVEVPQWDEMYTKDQVVAMLEQLDSEIQEQIAFMGDGEETNGMKRANNLVKDKINTLKTEYMARQLQCKKE